MFRKLMFGFVSFTAVLAGLYLLSGRGLGEMLGYARATADKSVESVEEALPREVRDRKLEQDLRQARQEVIDHQVQLNLAKGQIERVRNDVELLEGSVTRRGLLLGEAYAVLRDAIDRNVSAVRFASTEFTMDAFQREVDELMDLQQGESQQLKAKKEGLAGLEKGLREREPGLADMRRVLEKTTGEVALLKARREQAEIERVTLDLFEAASAQHTSDAAAFGQSIDRLKKEVERIEATNQARRVIAPVSETGAGKSEVVRSFNRLEALKRLHDDTAPHGIKVEVSRAE